MGYSKILTFYSIKDKNIFKISKYILKSILTLDFLQLIYYQKLFDLKKNSYVSFQVFSFENCIIVT